MGRWSWLLAIAAGCYSPSRVGDCAIKCNSNECPIGLGCVGGYCTSGPTCSDGGIPIEADAAVADAVFDAPAPNVGCTMFPSWTTPVPLAITAAPRVEYASYTIDLAPTIATFEQEVVKRGAPDSSMLGALLADTSFHAPHVSPDGLHVYLLHDEGGGTYRVAVMSRAATRDQFPLGPVTATIRDEATIQQTFGIDDVPGTPTITSPRRMMMRIAATAQFWELEEETPNTNVWTIKYRYPADHFGPVAPDDPSLSPDGMRLIFTGTVSGFPRSIFGVMRPNINVMFPRQAIRLVSPPVEQPFHPFMKQNCTALYYYTAASGVMRSFGF